VRTLLVEVQPAKCAVYSSNAAAARSVATRLDVQHAHDGLLATGTTMGTAAFQEAKADACADRVCALMHRMQALPLLNQDHWILLRSSLQR
jgi:hypothetical protein